MDLNLSGMTFSASHLLGAAELHPDLTSGVVVGLGWLYLILAAMNIAWTVRSFKQDGEYESVLGFGHIPKASGWAFYSALLVIVAIAHLTGGSDAGSFWIRLPGWFKDFVDGIVADPLNYFLISIVLFFGVIWAREFLVKPTVGWVILNLSILFLTLSMTDYDFRQIVGKPDNVPIVGMLYIVGFFTWLYFKKAVENDRRIEQGLPKIEDEQSEQVLVWPDLVYTELICMIVLTAVLVVWGVLLQAPLEEAASSVKTPNPSKAPWYFLGLQEMLVYYDPWMAGVVLPSLIVVGLMALPYIDFNTKGNGYYSFNERKFSIMTFLFGFLPLWVAMIILGTFLRGPNWNMFGPYEYWDVHKLEVLNNVNLSEKIWLDGLGMGLPRPGAEDGAMATMGIIFLRESVGIVAVLAYLLLLPPLMAATFFRKFFVKMGFLRYMVLANLALFMAALPIKMALRWAFNLKYIVAIPEWFFNI